MLACDVDAERRDGRPLPAHGRSDAARMSPQLLLDGAGRRSSPAAVNRCAGHASVAFTLTRSVKALAGTEAGDAARIEAFLSGS